MADKDRNGPVSGGKDEDWDFDSFSEGFGDDAFDGKPAAAAADDEFSEEALGSDPFSEGFDSFGFGDDDAEEEAPKPSAAPDPHAESEDDPFGGDEDVFGLEEMPTPGSEMARPEGDPDDEFGDLGGEAFAESDGFGGDDGLFDEPGDGDAQDDPFADDAEAEDPFADEASGPHAEDEGDPFAGDHEGDVEAGQDEAPAGRKGPSGLSKLLVPVALAASVALVGYVGYSMLLPMLSFRSAPPPPAVAEAPQDPSFPSALPGQPGGLPLPAPAAPDPSGARPEAPPAGLPEPVLHQPGEPEQPLLPVPAQDPAAAPSLSSADGLPAPAAPPLPEPPVAADGGLTLPSLDDIAGSEGRGGIHALRDGEGDEPSPSAEASPDRLAALEERLSAIESRVEGIARSIESLRGDAAEAPPAQPAAVQAPAKADLSSAAPPLKPAILESATLKGVSRGLAWVSTPSGVVEVREGDVIPGAGKVLRIREYQGRWIVSTPEGLVLQ